MTGGRAAPGVGAAPRPGELDDMIRFEGEQTTLDFKKTQYARPQFEALLKDVLSMANAHTEADRFILCGVKLRPDGSRELVGIDPATIEDPATFQQLVRENIEPEPSIDYFAYQIEGVTVGVLRLSGCTDRPYAMRKQYGALMRGHMWIRKGSHQMPVERSDLERIYAARAAAGAVGPLHVGFDAPGLPDVIELPAAGEILLPSIRARRRIERILEARRRPAKSGTLRLSAFELLGFAGHFFDHESGTFVKPYEAKSNDELLSDLEGLTEELREDDEYERFALYAHPLNLRLRHDGTAPLDDVRVELHIPSTAGLEVASDEPRKPRRGYNHLLGPSVDIPLPDHRHGYPPVHQGSGGTFVVQEIGTVRHKTAPVVFGMDLWVLVEAQAVGERVPLKCSVHARNLPEPFRTTLTLVVAEPDGTLPRAEDAADE